MSKIEIRFLTCLWTYSTSSEAGTEAGVQQGINGAVGVRQQRRDVVELSVPVRKFVLRVGLILNFCQFK